MIGKKAVIDHKPFHIADLMETWADIEKAKNLLGWEPKVSLDEGLEKSVSLVYGKSGMVEGGKGMSTVPQIALVGCGYWGKTFVGIFMLWVLFPLLSMPLKMDKQLLDPLPLMRNN